MSEPACWSWPVVLPEDVALPEYLRQSSEGMQRAHRELQAFEDFHAGRCAVCGARTARPVLDHCHASNLMRGMLCRSCNRSEASQDGVFAAYRQRPPAAILDFWSPYRDGPTFPERFGEDPPVRMARTRRSALAPGENPMSRVL